LFPPLDTPFMLDLKDLQALEADTLKAKQLGFAANSASTESDPHRQSYIQPAT